jgi:hypothetical protein
MLAIGGVMGGLSLAQGIMGGLSANSQAQAQQMQAELAARNANFQRQWQVETTNRNIDKRNLARAINNKKLEQAALNERGISEVYQKLGYDNSKGQFSKQTNQVNSALLSSVSGRNIDMSSGTARALLRQNLQNATVNMANLRISNMNKMRDINTIYQNKLAQRDFNYEEHAVFIPGDTSTVSGGSMVNVIGGAALGGISAGLSGALMFGADSPLRS